MGESNPPFKKIFMPQSHGPLMGLFPKLIILDRDGVINQDLTTGCRCLEEFTLLPGVIKALQLINKSGIPVVIATNQALVGRGELSLDGLERIHDYMRQLLADHGVSLGRIYVCTDTKIAPHYRRKPAPGMMLEAIKQYGVSAQETIFIGDAQTDLQAANAAGCLGILVKTGKGLQTLSTLPHDFRNVPVYDNLYHAVKNVLKI